MFFAVLLFFVLGTIVGSFLNVFIDKMLHGRSLWGRSHCDYCKKTLSPWDLVPILSYLMLRGRCRHCRRKIPPQYPVVEFLSGLLFACVFYFQVLNSPFDGIKVVYLILISAVLLVVATVDFRYYLIPTTLVFAASLLALFYDFFSYGPGEFAQFVFAAFAAAVFFGAIVLVTRGRGMGSGDIVLGFLIGMVLGFAQMVLAIFMAFVIGAVVAILLVILGRKKFKQAIAFGPFMILGFYIALWFYQPVTSWYLGLF
jgi:prepilin signal peptidase PulO-like enzyme (type II secretory pathway)